MLARPDGLGSLAPVQGDPDHPANRGRLCGKGRSLADTLGGAGRLTRARMHGRPVALEAALARSGPSGVAFYLSGQMLTEDYYAANKLAKGFLGTANVDTNSRLCMSSTVAGHVRAFGEDLVPGAYDDLDGCDLAVLVGSNAAWCHPVLFGRLMDARGSRGTRLVVIDPRRTETAAGRRGRVVADTESASWSSFFKSRSASVVFPAPDGPMMLIYSPSSMCRETSFKTSTSRPPLL